MLGIPPEVLLALGGVFGLLIVATVVVLLLRGRINPEVHTELRLRVQSWWVMVVIFTAAIAMSRTVSLVFFAFVSFLALKEYLSLIPTRRVDRQVIFWAYLTIPIQYLLIANEQYGMFLLVVPVYAFLLLPMRMVLAGDTTNFLRAAGTLHWGLMAMVFAIGHVAYLLVLPGTVDPAAGNAGATGAGLVLYLVFLTQFNDIAQYVFGKAFGRHKVVPKVSPGKTVEGLIGGLVTTAALGWLLGGWLTPHNQWQSLLAGLIIGSAGFVGDVTISALKRDLGVKDSGSLLPGHGGILDRVDSLIYTAPLFFHYTRFIHF